jgi:hypothetical protein
VGVADVRVIAATFKDRRSANRTLKLLRGAFDLGEEDAQLAPLGVAGTENDDSIVLAGRFWEARVATVCEMVERYGGNVVVDVDEDMTRRRVTPVPVCRPESSNGRRAKAQPRSERVLFH